MSQPDPLLPDIEDLMYLYKQAETDEIRQDAVERVKSETIRILETLKQEQKQYIEVLEETARGTAQAYVQAIPIEKLDALMEGLRDGN